MISPFERKLKSWKKAFTKPVAEQLLFPSLSPKSTHDSISTYSSADNDFSTASSPSSASYLNLMINKDKGPKIKPYIYTQCQTTTPNHKPSFNKRIGDNKCFICEELIQTKLATETILELQCGDYIHEQCFAVAINFKIDKLLQSSTFTASKSKLASLILPICNGKNCQNLPEPITLVDLEYLNQVLTKAITKSIEYDCLQLPSYLDHSLSEQESPLHPSRSPVSSPPSHFIETPNSTPPNPYRSSRFSRISTNNKNSNLDYTSSGQNSIASKPGSSIYNSSRLSNQSLTSSLSTPFENGQSSNSYQFQGLRSPIDFSRRRTRDESGLSYPSLASIRSPSPNPSVYTINDCIKMRDHHNIPLENLKDQLLEKLVSSCSKFKLNILIKLGNLRLADSLLVRSNDLENWKSQIVYLFDNSLVTFDSTYKHNIFDLDQSSFAIEKSVVKISNTLRNKDIMLNSDIPSIIEKWVVAFSDIGFTFPSDILTSSINLTIPFFNKSRSSDSTINIIPEVSSNGSSTKNSLRDADITIEVADKDSNMDGSKFLGDDAFRSNASTKTGESHPVTASISVYYDSDEDMINEIMQSLKMPNSQTLTQSDSCSRNSPGKYKDFQMEINETFPSPTLSGSFKNSNSDVESDSEFDSDEEKINAFLNQS